MSPNNYVKQGEYTMACLLARLYLIKSHDELSIDIFSHGIRTLIDLDIPNSKTARFYGTKKEPF